MKPMSNLLCIVSLTLMVMCLGCNSSATPTPKVSAPSVVETPDRSSDERPTLSDESPLENDVDDESTDTDQKDPWVIRTDFSDDQAWEKVSKQVRAPVTDRITGQDFRAYVRFIEDPQYKDLATKQLVIMLKKKYRHSFVFVVDQTTFSTPGNPILVINLGKESQSEFRAIPMAIQGIENNLSIANMDFEDFAEAADRDGIFRGFPMPR